MEIPKYLIWYVDIATSRLQIIEHYNENKWKTDIKSLHRRNYVMKLRFAELIAHEEITFTDIPKTEESEYSGERENKYCHRKIKFKGK